MIIKTIQKISLGIFVAPWPDIVQSSPIFSKPRHNFLAAAQESRVAQFRGFAAVLATLVITQNCFEVVSFVALLFVVHAQY